jgi:hypothetical protein
LVAVASAAAVVVLGARSLAAVPNHEIQIGGSVCRE